MHWDYWTYQKQPPYFIEEIRQHLGVEAQAQKENRDEPIKPTNIPTPRRGRSFQAGRR